MEPKQPLLETPQLPPLGMTPTVSAGSLANPSTLVNVPQPRTTQNAYDFVQNLEPAIKSGQEGLVRAQTREAEQRNDVLSRLLDVDGADTKGTYDAAFSKAGGEGFTRELADANTRLATLQGKFRTNENAISTRPGQSQVFESVQLRESDRAKAIEVGNQALLVQALQGNVETARQIALDTANFASEDRKTELSNLIAQYNALDGIVTGQEKQLIDEKKAAAEAEKAQLERLDELIDSAITGGAATVQEMQQLSDPRLSTEEKIAIAMEAARRGGAISAELDNDYKAAQTAKLMGEIAGETGADPQQLQAYAAQYASTGTIPTGLSDAGLSFGQVAEAAKVLPKSTGTVVDANTGIKSSSVPAAQQDDYAKLYNIVKNTERLKEVDSRRVLGVFKGPKDLVEYNTLVKAIVDDISRMQSGAALTESEVKTYSDYLPGDINFTNKIENFEKIMRDKLENGLNNNGLRIYGYSKVNVDGFGEKTVGETVTNESGATGRVLPDGTVYVEETPPDFSSAGNASASKLARSIIQQESGGKYSAVGIPTAHGRALGKYQIIPKFHFAKVGLNPNSEKDRQRFLKTPALQDRLFSTILNEWSEQYGGDPAKIAAAYYGGDGGVKKLGTPAGDKPQPGGMPSINSYVRQVLARIS